MVQEIANRPELRRNGFSGGDIQLIGNLTVMHARQSYEDYEEPEMKRHLLRMWMVFGRKRRPLSPLLDERYEYVHNGGIQKQAAAKTMFKIAKMIRLVLAFLEAPIKMSSVVIDIAENIIVRIEDTDGTVSWGGQLRPPP